MTLSTFETTKVELLTKQFIEKRRPPVDIRDQVDLSFRINNQSVEIFEIRPLWSNPNKKIEESVAKATFVKSKGIWKIFWQRADLKWHRYDPDSEVRDISEFLEIVDKDEYCCFWG